MTFEKLSYQEYDSRPGVSQSQIQQMRRSPAHCKAYIDGHRRETEAKDFGKLLHHAILEPEDFMNCHLVPPFPDRRTKAYKEWAEENLVPGKVEVTAAEKRIILGCMDSIREHPVGSKIFDGSEITEVSMFATHLQTGIMRKGRLDAVYAGRNFLPDVKTSVDACPREFERSLYTYGYYIQAAYYLDLARANGVSVDSFIFIAVEKEPPYACAFYEVEPEAIERGRIEYERLLERFKQCHESGQWPAYSQELQFIGLPKWAKEAA